MISLQSPSIKECLVDEPASSKSYREAGRLLEKNHNELDMYFRDRGGHNHIVHSILTNLALGASPSEIQKAYDDLVESQRPMPPTDDTIVAGLTDDEQFLQAMYDVAQYPNFLRFFKNEIEKSGYQAVVNKYCFNRTKLAEKMLASLFEGAYHPIIHLGLGIEFDEPSIVAEALAQTASHDDSHVQTLLTQSAELAACSYPAAKPKTLVELLQQVRCNDTIHNAPKWEDFGNKFRDGVIGRAGPELVGIAAQFVINGQADLERRTAEMINAAAYMAGASQVPGRKRKIDFFYMHSVTSSIFFSILIEQSWIKLEDRIRLVENKARSDLAWYAASGSPSLDSDMIAKYPDDDATIKGLNWTDIFREAIDSHDDGHVVKFLRALKNGEERSKPFQHDEKWSEYFPMKDDMWLRLAKMCLDTTTGLPDHLKWIHHIGFEMGWKVRPDLA